MWIINNNNNTLFYLSYMTNNPLLCDPTTGVCAIPQNNQSMNLNSNEKIISKPLQMVYYTDPICSSCRWIEWQLRKVQLEYWDIIDTTYIMWWLLPDWSYNSGGISKPSDVASHWDEVSVYYDMPIDGDIWLEDPLPSSYPSCIAYKAAQLQDKKKSYLFLRKIKEMVFLEKKNITKRENLSDAAKYAWLDLIQFEEDYQYNAKTSFLHDLEVCQKAGVRGFPTIILSNQSNKKVIYWVQDYHIFEDTILSLYPWAKSQQYPQTSEFLFSQYDSFTLKEYSILSWLSREKAEWDLKTLSKKGEIQQITTKNWSLRRKIS